VVKEPKTMDGHSANTQVGGAAPAAAGPAGEAVLLEDSRDALLLEELGGAILLEDRRESVSLEDPRAAVVPEERSEWVSAPERAANEPDEPEHKPEPEPAKVTSPEVTEASGPESDSPTGSESESPAGSESESPAGSESDSSTGSGSDGVAESASTPAPAAPAAESSTPKAPPTWPRGLLAAATAFYEWLGRPRVRLAGTGVLLLFVGGLVLTNSVWTLPLVLVGSAMVVIAWIGPRLDGKFAVEWGHTGTQLAFRAKIRSPEPHRAHHLLHGASTSHELVRAYPHPPNPPGGQIVDGHADTVEVDVASLKALIAAVESRGGQTATRPDGQEANRHGPDQAAAANEDAGSPTVKSEGREGDDAGGENPEHDISEGDAFGLGHRTLRVAYGDQRASEAG
jgi:hypothetical protein